MLFRETTRHIKVAERVGTFTTLFLFLLQSLGTVFAQTQAPVGNSTTPSTDNSSPADSDTKPPSATALGDIFFKSRNSLLVSFGADEIVQDNALYDSEGSERFDTSTHMYSRVAYQRQYPRTSFELDYTLGGRIYNRSSTYNQIVHDGGISVSRKLSPRWALTLADRASVTPDAGRILQGDLVISPLPPDVLPNNTVILRLNKTILNTAYIDFNVQRSRRSSFSFGANSTISRFEQGNLREQNRYGSHLSYNYQMSERTIFNVGYNFNYFDITTNDVPVSGPITPSHLVRNHYPYIGVSHQFNRLVSGFVDVGPNYTVGDSINLGTSLHFKPGVRASVNAGIVLAQSLSLDPRTFFSMNLNQSVSDGFGLGAVVQRQIASASLGRRVTRNTTIAATGGYSRNKFLTDFDESGEEIITNSVYVGANLRINLTERFNFHANYNRVRQLSTGFFELIPARLSGNTAAVGIAYTIPMFF